MEQSISKKSWCRFALLPLIIMSLKAHLSTASDTLYPGQPLAWNQTLSSRNGIFELGFFTPGKSHNYYLGIWYKTNSNLVWHIHFNTRKLLDMLMPAVNESWALWGTCRFLHLNIVIKDFFSYTLLNNHMSPNLLDPLVQILSNNHNEVPSADYRCRNPHRNHKSHKVEEFPSKPRLRT